MQKRNPRSTLRKPTLQAFWLLAVLGLLSIPSGSFAAGEEICFSTQRHMVGGAPDSLDAQAADIARLFREDAGLAGAGADNLTGQGNVAVFILSKDGEPVKIFSGRSGSQNSLAHQMDLHGDVRLDSVSQWERPGFTFHSEPNVIEAVYAHFNQLGDKTFWDSYDRITVYTERAPCHSCGGGLREFKINLRNWFRENAVLWNRNNYFQFSTTYEYNARGNYVGHKRWSWYLPGDFTAIP